MQQCHYCQTVLESSVLNRNRQCPSCGSDLICCRNCVYFSSKEQCQEPNSPWIGNREAQNNCNYFEFRKNAQKHVDNSTEVERAKEAFRALFKEL